MVSRPILAILVITLAVLVVASCVLLGFQALLRFVGDGQGAAVILWIAVASLLLLVIDLVLLVGALGLNAISAPEGRAEPSEEPLEE